MRNRGSSRTIDNEKLEQVSADLDVTGRRRDPCLKVERKKEKKRRRYLSKEEERSEKESSEWKVITDRRETGKG